MQGEGYIRVWFWTATVEGKQIQNEMRYNDISRTMKNDSMAKRTITLHVLLLERVLLYVECKLDVTSGCNFGQLLP